jgi:hypothetical protein
MIIFTSHVKPRRLPVLVREGFSWGAAIFGWLWLLAQGAWVPALLVLAGGLVAGKLMMVTQSVAPLVAIVLVQGVFGRDLVRWWLRLRGYAPASPVAALTHDAALLRLLSERPDLASGLDGSRL